MQLELPFASSTFVEKPGGRNALPIRRPASEVGDQLVLPGCGIKQLDNLFFAVRPTAVAAGLADDLARTFGDEYGLRGQPRGDQLYHVTLHGLGTFDTVPRALVALAAEVAGSVKMSPFDVHFDRIVSFATKNQNYPLVLLGGDRLSELRELHARIGDALRNARFKRIAKLFTPHMTLLYDSRLVSETRVPPVSWTVRDFALIHSPQGHSLHKILDRWTLRD